MLHCSIILFVQRFMKTSEMHMEKKMQKRRIQMEIGVARGGQVTPDIFQVEDAKAIRRIHLSSANLTHIPEDVFGFPNLTELYLDFNAITEIPAEIGRLTNLRKLSLMHNHLTDVPAEIGCLTNLLYISLGNNEIVDLPDQIGNLHALEVLHLSDNQLVNLPSTMGELVGLKGLNVKNNQLVSLPKFQSGLELRLIDASNNQIGVLGDDIGQLTKLEELGMADNQLVNLPSTMGELVSLRELDVTRNQLVELPVEMSGSGLEALFASRNQLTNLPAITTMRELIVSHNCLASLDFVHNMVSLSSLIAHHNQITQLPSGIGQLLTRLYSLDVANNQISDLPNGLSNLNRLGFLAVHGNPLDANTIPELGNPEGVTVTREVYNGYLIVSHANGDTTVHSDRNKVAILTIRPRDENSPLDKYRDPNVDNVTQAKLWIEERLLDKQPDDFYDAKNGSLHTVDQMGRMDQSHVQKILDENKLYHSKITIGFLSK